MIIVDFSNRRVPTPGLLVPNDLNRLFSSSSLLSLLLLLLLMLLRVVVAG
jgi:hypothetical protein